MFLDRQGDGIDRLEDFFGGVGIGNFHLELLVQNHHQLQRVHGIQTQTARAE